MTQSKRKPRHCKPKTRRHKTKHKRRYKIKRKERTRDRPLRHASMSQQIKIINRFNDAPKRRPKRRAYRKRKSSSPIFDTGLTGNLSAINYPLTTDLINIDNIKQLERRRIEDLQRKQQKPKMIENVQRDVPRIMPPRKKFRYNSKDKDNQVHHMFKAITKDKILKLMHQWGIQYDSTGRSTSKQNVINFLLDQLNIDSLPEIQRLATSAKNPDMAGAFEREEKANVEEIVDGKLDSKTSNEIFELTSPKPRPKPRPEPKPEREAPTLELIDEEEEDNQSPRIEPRRLDPEFQTPEHNPTDSELIDEWMKLPHTGMRFSGERVTVIPDDVFGLGNKKKETKLQPLYGSQIDAVMEPYRDDGYLGWFNSDEVGDIGETDASNKFDRLSFIINTSKSSDAENDPDVWYHWKACFIDFINEKEVCCYCPLATEMPEQLQKDLKKIVDKRKKNKYLLKFKTNHVRNQRNDTDTCGFHCINFLKDRYAGIPFREASGFDSKEGEALKLGKKMKKFGYI